MTVVLHWKPKISLDHSNFKKGRNFCWILNIKKNVECWILKKKENSDNNMRYLSFSNIFVLRHSFLDPLYAFTLGYLLPPLDEISVILRCSAILLILLLEYQQSISSLKTPFLHQIPTYFPYLEKSCNSGLVFLPVLSGNVYSQQFVRSLFFLQVLNLIWHIFFHVSCLLPFLG